jgi:chromosome segregation ATPase
MNRSAVSVAVASWVCAVGAVRCMGQGADAAGSLAALEAQKSQLRAEMQAAEAKRADIVKAIEAKPLLSEAKKLWDSAETAYQEFVKSNADYSRLSKARGESDAAVRKALEDGRIASPEYMALRKQADELRAKLGALGSDATADKTAIGAEMKVVEGKKAEIRKAIESQPACAEKVTAAAAAAKAFNEFCGTNADYTRLVKARDDAANAYRKARDEATAADPDYTAVRNQREELRKKLADIERQMAAARPK